jgi:formate--tetrahydrofolate ligase
MHNVLPDNEIARAISLKPITEVAAELGVPEDALIPYGRFKAKIDLDVATSLPSRPDSKLILVTAMTPLEKGEGKTTVAIGVGDGLKRIGKKAVVCLREPSLGPCFGLKGGATGAGHAQVAPRDDINLHFTGDCHAVASANNLLAALVDNHLFRRASPALDSRRITWRRTLDMNDRALREVVVGLGGAANGYAREEGFDITPGSEVMAVLCLAQDRADLEQRLARIVIGYTPDRQPIRASDLAAQGAMSALLRDALAPNLVQSLEHNPVLVHGGPFANIAHGCNSVIATKTALALGDYVLTEAGFGADLGAEKFFDIKCRQSGLVPSAAIIVATVESLKAHGGVAASAGQQEDVAAVKRGLPNLLHHMSIINTYGLSSVVAINRYEHDSEAELAAIKDAVADNGAVAIVSEHWRDGGKGAENLAVEVARLADAAPGSDSFQLLYPDDMSLIEKTATIATRIYGAASIAMDDGVRRQYQKLQAEGFGHLPICLAKTPRSLSTDPREKGVPRDFTLTIRELRLAAGAGFVVALAGDVLMMPGMPAEPSARHIFVNARGEIEGLR